MLKKATRESIGAYLFLSPWLFGFVGFIGGPIIVSLGLSFYKWDILSPPRWVGLGNYVKLLHDPLFLQCLIVTVIYTTVSLILTLAFALLIALLLNCRIKGIVIFRAIYYLPAVISGVVLGLTWQWILDPESGIVNYLLSSFFGIEGPGWMYSSDWALISLIIISLWPIGPAILIYLAGLQGIPDALYEAADIEGAGKLRKFLHITLPLLSPIIFFNLFMVIINSFQVFSRVYVTTGGGPHYATLLYVLYFYKRGFEWLQLGYASALAWIFFVIMFLITILLFKTSGSWVYYQSKR
jgi:multiple sugar transport system permease protein